MIARGNALLEAGDIVSARRFFERAYRLGNERAARPLARTYDPLVLNSLGVKGLKADPAKALTWYAKARSAGQEEVAADIEALQAFLAD
jgi:TPR repeat protein